MEKKNRGAEATWTGTIENFFKGESETETESSWEVVPIDNGGGKEEKRENFLKSVTVSVTVTC